MISAIVHTRNEEKNIDRCLSSLEWTDEIVVVDMHSVDKTCRLAREYGAKIYNHPYTGYVEPARNFGIQKAKGDYLIIVDADEQITSQLATFLKQAAKDKEYDFFRLPRKNIIFGRWIKHAGWWPDYQVRFFKKGKVSWVDKLHGVPITEGKGYDVEEKEELAIIHYHYESIEQYIERLQRYSTQAAKELFLEDKKFFKRYLFEKPAEEFVRRFFYLKGYKDGLYGLALSLLQSFSECVTYLKLWQLYGFKREKVSLEEVGKYLKQERRLKSYWMTHERLRDENSLLKKISIKIKNKVNL